MPVAWWWLTWSCEIHPGPSWKLGLFGTVLKHFAMHVENLKINGTRSPVTLLVSSWTHSPLIQSLGCHGTVGRITLLCTPGLTATIVRVRSVRENDRERQRRLYLCKEISAGTRCRRRCELWITNREDERKTLPFSGGNNKLSIPGW